MKFSRTYPANPGAKLGERIYITVPWEQGIAAFIEIGKVQKTLFVNGKQGWEKITSGLSVDTLKNHAAETLAPRSLKVVIVGEFPEATETEGGEGEIDIQEPIVLQELYGKGYGFNVIGQLILNTDATFSLIDQRGKGDAIEIQFDNFDELADIASLHFQSFK